VVSHVKTEGKLGGNYLMSELGDKINALLCGAGHNIRIILKKLREMMLFWGLFAVPRKWLFSRPTILDTGAVSSRYTDHSLCLLYDCWNY
jgi:hypothetical protein